MDLEECYTIERCDIFDFMAKYVGLSVLHPGGFRATDILSENCRIGKHSKVLDIACGKGSSAAYLAQKHGCLVVGIDISADLIDEAKNLTKRKGLEDRVSFRVADALDLPFSDGEFDAAVSQAMLVLVNDKARAIQEAMRVIKPNGYAGWIELSWKNDPTEEFMHKVSNEICAYCMTNVHTYDGWKSLFSEAGVKQLKVIVSSMEFQGFRGMIVDEGLWNSCRIILKYLGNSRIRRRMNSLNKFFKSHPQYFGFGIYVGKKQIEDQAKGSRVSYH